MGTKGCAKRRVWAVVLLGTTLVPIGCGDKKDKEETGKRISAVLRSSNLEGQSLHLTQDTQLINVTGLADSIGLNGDSAGGACGFDVWSADGQDGRAGLEGRSYEPFDLGDPTSWTSLGWGLQGECDSITIWQVESYFVYMDLELAVAGVPKTVRAYMAQQAPFEAGDIVLKNGENLFWYDTVSEELIASTETRPDAPAAFHLSKEVPWYDNNGADKIIMMEFRIDVDDLTKYVVTKDTGHVDVDVDFTNSGLSISDTSSDEALMKTINLPFLDTSAGGSLLKASLLISQDRPADDTAEQ